MLITCGHAKQCEFDCSLEGPFLVLFAYKNQALSYFFIVLIGRACSFVGD